MNYQARSQRIVASRWLPIITAALAVAIFIVQLLSELRVGHLGISVDTLFVVVVLMSAGFLRARGVVLVGAGCIGLTALTYFLLPPLLAYFKVSPESDPIEGPLNAVITGTAIGLVTYLVLREKVAADALHQAQGDLTRLNRVLILGEMAASIAHEIKQPVCALMAQADAGLRWLDAQPPELEEIRQSLSQILKAGNRVGEVIDRVRSLVKQASPRKDRLDINEAIGEAIALTKAELERNGVRLQTQLSGNLPRIQGDRVQLQQVIINLVINASDAMSGVRGRPRELTIASNINGAKDVSIEVRDTGSGLDTANLDRMFRSFYTTKPNGMGMGLSICRTIVEAHGGQLSAAPAKPYGAVFALTLPIEAQASQYPEPSSARPAH